MEHMTDHDTTTLLTRCANVLTNLMEWNQYMGSFDATIWRKVYHLRCSLAQNRLDPRALCGHPFNATDEICNICQTCPTCCPHASDV